MEAAPLAWAVALVEARRGRAQLVVLRYGQIALDHTVDCSPDALFLLYSVSKPFVAMLVHLLAQRGALSLDDPVATYWPEFAFKGKGSITVRHVLQHRAGLPLAGGLLRTLSHLADWTSAVRDVERARPRWPPGQVPAYHPSATR